MHFRFDALSNGKYGSPPQRTPFIQSYKATGLLPHSDFENLDNTSHSQTLTKSYDYSRTPNPNPSKKFGNIRKPDLSTPAKREIEMDGYFGTQGQG